MKVLVWTENETRIYLPSEIKEGVEYKLTVYPSCTVPLKISRVNRWEPFIGTTIGRWKNRIEEREKKLEELEAKVLKKEVTMDYNYVEMRVNLTSEKALFESLMELGPFESI